MGESKVYRMNDYEWILTRVSIEEATKAYQKEYEVEDDEVDPQEVDYEKDMVWFEATEEDMEKFKKYKVPEIEGRDVDFLKEQLNKGWRPLYYKDVLDYFSDYKWGEEEVFIVVATSEW